jgi:hypothetical protein
MESITRWAILSEVTLPWLNSPRHTQPEQKKLWKLKVPVKNYSFVFTKKVILTKDNLATQNWNGSVKCSFCLNNETIKHLFFECQVARVI